VPTRPTFDLNYHSPVDLGGCLLAIDRLFDGLSHEDSVSSLTWQLRSGVKSFG
jgi:hypothetical protein